MQPGNLAPSRLERIYLQSEGEFGQIPQAGGLATLSGADACRHITCRLQPTVKLLQRPDKTGTRTASPGEAGQMGAKWELELSLSANGVPSRRPDCDPLLTALMGQSGTVQDGSAEVIDATNTAPIQVTAANSFSELDVITIEGADGSAGPGLNGTWVIGSVTPEGFVLLGSAGTGSYTGGATAFRQGVKYSLSDAVNSFSLWRFRQPATLQQMVGLGCVVGEAKFLLGQDIARWTLQGDAKWVLDSQEAPYADVDQLGGLTAFPTEPAQAVTNGGLIAGFSGRAVVDGYPLATLRNIAIEIGTGNAIGQGYFGTAYGLGTEGGIRTVTVQFEVSDDDSATAQNLYHQALTKTPIDLVLQVGRVSGSMFVFVVRGLQLDMPSLEDGERIFTRKFAASLAHGSGLGETDELTIWAV